MSSDYQQYESMLREYILDKLPQVLKKPHRFIHYPFIDPGSVYNGNVWDWDTYWSVYAILGLTDYMDQGQIQDILIHAKGNVENFMDHQLEDGYIPMMIEVADWPEPYLNLKHKEGVLMNMHKPFLCQQICLISEYCHDYQWTKKFYHKLEAYFTCYRKNYYQENAHLYVWCDDIMIGVDNDPSSFGRPKFSTANIYLNSFMVMELKAMGTLCQNFGEEKRADFYRTEADDLIRAVREECWDKRDKIYYSVDVDVHTRSFDWFHQGLGVFWKSLPIKVRVWSSFLPMFAGFATNDGATYLKDHMTDPCTFWAPYGITSLAMDERMFNLDATNNPSNWLGPIWIVCEYICFRALLNYGYKEEAATLCRRTLAMMGRDLQETGCLHEYYDPFTGKGIMNGGFLNWNILVLNMTKELREMNIML